MMFNETVTLIKNSGEPTFDDYGNPTFNQETLDVPCMVKEVYATQFYEARNADIALTHKLVVNKLAYSGEKKAVFRGETFDIVRIYEIGGNSTRINHYDFSYTIKYDSEGIDLVELYLGEKIGNG